MKATVLIIAILLFCSSLYSQENNENEEYNQENDQETTQKVYICNSMTSRRYHYREDCTGLRRCNDSIRKISIRIARGSHGRTVCGFEAHRESPNDRNN